MSFDVLNKAQDRIQVKLDNLTGLLRKKDFFIQGEKLISENPGTWLLINIDLEHFKLFNDWYGWDTGNLVLAQIGAGLKKTAQETEGLAGYLENDDFSLLVLEKNINIKEIYTGIHHVLVEYGVSAGFLPALGISRNNILQFLP